MVPINGAITVNNGAPSRWAFFCIFFFGKKSYFNAIESHFVRVQSRLKELDF